MEKQIEIENLQQEVARLTAENETLKNENNELESSKKFWVDRSNEYENKYRGLVEQVKSVGVLVNGMVAA